ncbi:hypothetical protein S245_025943, partial [Arachis hypogaea]
NTPLPLPTLNSRLELLHTTDNRCREESFHSHCRGSLLNVAGRRALSRVLGFWLLGFW